MSSSVCHGLQSCLEPSHLIEPRVLRLKLALPKSNLSRCAAPRPCLTDPVHDLGDPNHKPLGYENSTRVVVTTSTTNKEKNDVDYDEKTHQNVASGGWSFLQSLSTTSRSTREAAECEQVYVHPLVKRSSSMLSEKSLEMCTESLGSETGSEVSESGDDISWFSSESRACSPTSKPRRDLAMKKRTTRSTSFPPPITSISGSGGGVKVRPHREGGRLVLQAVSVSSSQAYFHAERSEGRLRLRLLKDCYPSYGNEDVKEEENVAEEEEEEQDYEEEDDEEGEAEAAEEAYGKEEEDIKGDNGNAEGEMEIEKLRTPSRCKGGESGHKGLLNWEPFWVAT